MARAPSDDLRFRILKALADGISARFGVRIPSAIRWIARAKIGERTPRLQGRRRGSGLDVHEAFIFGLIEDRKDIALNEMGASKNPWSNWW